MTFSKSATRSGRTALMIMPAGVVNVRDVETVGVAAAVAGGAAGAGGGGCCARSVAGAAVKAATTRHTARTRITSRTAQRSHCIEIASTKEKPRAAGATRGFQLYGANASTWRNRT